MSWIQKLHETYEQCAGREGAGSLLPIGHTTQQAHVEIVLDAKGRFRRASVLDKSGSTTVIPCTEESGGRAGSKPINHPLCDKLQYVSGDYLKFGGEVTSGFSNAPSDPHSAYLASLRNWATSEYGHPKLDAILRYVERKRVVADLVASQVLHVDAQGKLLKQWGGERDQAPPIFKVLQSTQMQEDAFVRWRVEPSSGEETTGTWQDFALLSAWIAYYQAAQTKRGICVVDGNETALAVQHPAKLRHSGDKAKLISSNDTSGFTFRGRFDDADEAVGVGFETTQKAHNALRWLIARQGYRNGDQVFVAWAVTGKPVPDPFLNTLALYGMGDVADAQLRVVDTAQTFAIRLNKALAGYRASLDANDDIVVIGVDSATPGRLAITFYRELKCSEFLERIEAWHTRYAWAQSFGKDGKFVGAPAPHDIAEAAHGRRLDEKLRKATVERTLPCIVDGAQMPLDLVASAVRRASNRVALELWEWEKCLGIACALYKGYYAERSYLMSLDPDLSTRDYLFGRLLAVAEHVEARALHVSGEKRDTTAARLMQRFADRPYSTWRTIELSLAPYKTRLRAQQAGFLVAMEKVTDAIMAKFTRGTYSHDAALSGEFLLGYHCQRLTLWQKQATAVEDEPVDKSN